MYQAVLVSNNSSRNYFIEFEIEVEEFQYLYEGDSQTELMVITSNVDYHIPIVIGLAAYEAVLTAVVTLIFWKYFKNRSSTKENGMTINDFT